MKSVAVPQVFRERFRSQRLNLICMPQAGVDSAVFARLTPQVAPECNIVPVALPGRAMRLNDSVPDHLEEMADEIFDSFLEHVVEPYALLGSSMGGWLGYELCKRIEAEGFPTPTALILAMSPTPDSPRNLPNLKGKSDTDAVELLHDFNPALAPGLEHEELLQLILPTIRADFAACLRYHPVCAPIETDILGFSGLGDTIVTPDSMKDWRNWTNGAFRLIQIPGDHSLLDVPPIGLVSGLRKLAAKVLG